MNETKHLVFHISYYENDVTIVTKTTKIDNAIDMVDAINQFKERYGNIEPVSISSSRFLH